MRLHPSGSPFRRLSRLFLLFGAFALVAAACGDDDDEAGSADTGTEVSDGEDASGEEASGGEFDELAIQFGWIKNAEFAGNYMADTFGYYTDEGFSSVALLGGGPAVDPIAPLIAGDALFSYAASEQVAAAVTNEDAPLVVIGANFQTNPFCLLYESDSPLESAEDLRGKTIGVQAVNEPVWQAALEANGLEEGTGPDQVNRIPVEFDPAPLVSGEVDGFFSFVSNEPNILRTEEGMDVGCLMLGDIGVDLYQQLYVTTQDNLENRFDELVAAMTAEVKGWQHAFADPEEAERLTLEVYGADLDLPVESQALELADQEELITAGDTSETGIFYMTEERIAENVELLNSIGFDVSEDMYTNAVLDEVYADGTELYEG
jgi:ABC-type nitrate/sulfonate/bicarbonate transport system substrate-binding protein